MIKREMKWTGIIYHWKNVKRTYRHHLHVLVYELVHYMWPKSGHGLAFEERIKQIIREGQALKKLIGCGIDEDGVTGLHQRSGKLSYHFYHLLRKIQEEIESAVKESERLR